MSGNVRLVHVIDLTNYEEILNRTIVAVERTNRTSIIKHQLEHQIKYIKQMVHKLKGVNSKRRRSINWIGSAWKWIAGSPDATDWDTVTKSQNDLIANNNEQYKINKKLMESTNEMLQQYNKIIEHLGNRADDKYEQMLFNRLSILKHEISEIVTAEHLAKSGIINTNLLDKTEINQLITQMETLPYENEIEAIEYAEPQIVIKGPIFLYIISMPKTSRDEYNHIIVRSTTKNNKRVHLEFKELLVNQGEDFGITEKCHSIKNVTICKEGQLEKLPEHHCISRLLKGAKAECDYEFSKNEEIEVINDNTIFLDNFSGELFEKNSTKHLKGSFIIQYNNETIKINEKEFINKEIRTFQTLPPVFQSSPAEKSVKLDVDYLHDLHLNNRKELRNLATRNGISLITDFSLFTMLIIIFGIIIAFKLRSKKAKLQIVHPTTFPEIVHPTAFPVISESFQDLRPVKINI